MFYLHVQVVFSNNDYDFILFRVQDVVEGVLFDFVDLMNILF